MDWDIIISILGGGGLASIFNWWSNRKLRAVKERLDRDDIAREMREKDSDTIQQLFNENKQLFEEVLNIKQLISRMVDCKFFTQCPARYELQDYKQKYFRQSVRQPRMAQKGVRNPRDNPDEPGGVDNPDGQPP